MSQNSFHTKFHSHYQTTGSVLSIRETCITSNERTRELIEHKMTFSCEFLSYSLLKNNSLWQRISNGIENLTQELKHWEQQHHGEAEKISELNFHIWNANSQSFAQAKSEAKMAAHGGKFWTSVSVLFAVLYVSFSPLNDFNFQFLLGSTSKTFTTMEKVRRWNITGPVFHIPVFKRIHHCCVV